MSHLTSHCGHRVYKRGSRSFGAHIPASCQGRYFPGDEPGEYCKLSGADCALTRPDPEPWECPLAQATDILCPACAGLPAGGPTLLSRLEDEYHCEKCQGSWTAPQLIQALSDTMHDERQNRMGFEEECARLRAELAEAR